MLLVINSSLSNVNLIHHDDKFSGILSGGVSLSSAGKSYTGDIETDARDIFNYEGFNYDDVYGGYGNTDEPS